MRKSGEVLGVEKTKEEMEDSVFDCTKAAVDDVNAKFVVSMITTVRLFPFAVFFSKELYEDIGGEVPHQPGHLGHLGQGGAGG